MNGEENYEDMSLSPEAQKKEAAYFFMQLCRVLTLTEVQNSLQETFLFKKPGIVFSRNGSSWGIITKGTTVGEAAPTFCFTLTKGQKGDDTYPSLEVNFEGPVSNAFNTQDNPLDYIKSARISLERSVKDETGSTIIKT